ncbi:erythromycin esterase family protein [Glycomyces arizonensis]|uniref:erythromycin esterase family protein n=1 Tax=Glycomyces arizonensis TaxID=256035 RepID=UPI000A06BEEC|nr:erythromycin esterase family protein [Glycomyces arizonensis]
MTQGILEFITDSHELVGLGEPTHGDAAFGRARNEVFARLVERGFRSFALESDRVAALAVDDFVREGTGTLDTAMSEGFSHGFGAFEANRALVAWMREYNEDRPAAERLSFHGLDAPLEFTGASPRADLEYARDYLGLDLDIAGLVGDDERWSRTEAVTDPAESPGDTDEAGQLRVAADDMLTWLYARAPELIAATSLADWRRAETHLTSGLGLLRYHRQAAQHIEDRDRWERLSAVRDALMARNLLDIRDVERGRGPTLVSAHNVHLQLHPSRMRLWQGEITWHGTGAIVASLLGERYAFVAGRPGRGEAPGARAAWVLTAADPAASEGADAVLHVG